MRKWLFLAVLALWCSPSKAATIYVKASPPTQTVCVVNGSTTTCYPQRISAPIVKVAQLASYPYAGAWAAVTDGNSATDCTVGGGSTVVFCLYSGSSWSAVGGSAGTVTSVSGTANQIASTGGATPVLSLTSPVIFPGNVSGAAGFTISSADTGTPTITFGTNSIAFNQPISNTNSVLTTPNLGTPSAINLTNATSLAAAAIPVPTPATLGGTLRNTYFSSNGVGTATNGVTGTAVAQNATKVAAFYISSYVQVSNITYSITTADNTANVYDIGYYGPGCLAGATNVPLVAHTGPTAGTSLASGTGAKSLALSASNINITPGWYCFAYTSSAASPAAVFGGASNNQGQPFIPASAPGGGTGTTTSGTLNSTITAPATSWIFSNNGIFVGGY